MGFHRKTNCKDHNFCAVKRRPGTVTSGPWRTLWAPPAWTPLQSWFGDRKTESQEKWWKSGKSEETKQHYPLVMTNSLQWEIDGPNRNRWFTY